MQRGSWGSDRLWQRELTVPVNSSAKKEKKENTDIPRKAKRRQIIVLGWPSSNPFSILHFCFKNQMVSLVVSTIYGTFFIGNKTYTIIR